MLRVKCTHCGHTVRGDDDWAGRTGNCPKCQAPISFPDIASLDPQPQPPLTAADPVVSKWTQLGRNAFFTLLFLFIGAMGYWVLQQSILATWTGKSLGLRHSPGVLRADKPFSFWFETIFYILSGSLALIFGAAGMFGIAKSVFAALPLRFSLRALLITTTLVAVVLGLATYLFTIALTTIHGAGNVRPIMLNRLFAFFFLGGLGVLSMGASWFDYSNGYKRFRGFLYGYVLHRKEHPRAFAFMNIIQFLIGIVLFIVAIRLFLFGVQ